MKKYIGVPNIQWRPMITGAEFVELLKSQIPDRFEQAVREAGDGKRPLEPFKLPSQGFCFDMDMSFAMAEKILVELVNACAYQLVTIASVEDIPKNPAHVILHFKKL